MEKRAKINLNFFNSCSDVADILFVPGQVRAEDQNVVQLDSRIVQKLIRMQGG